MLFCSQFGTVLDLQASPRPRRIHGHIHRPAGRNPWILNMWMSASCRFRVGTLVPRGMDRPFGWVFGRLGILSDSHLYNSLYWTLVRTGAPVGTLRSTSRTLRSANGTPIEISGCSHCVVSFMGLQTEFPILICDLNTDAITRTDTLGSVLPHTLAIKIGLLFMEGGVSLQLHNIDTALSGRVFTVGHCSVPPYSEAVLHCTIRTVGGRPMSSSGLLEGRTLFAENTGLVVGRTLVDPSSWSVPVLVSNFSQETVMVEPFSEVGMVAQISAIQSITEPHCRASCNGDSLPAHLQELLDQTSRDLDSAQQYQLADVLFQYSDLLPVPGSTLTGHTDEVEHENRYRTQYTNTLCSPPDVASENQAGRRVCHWHAGRWANWT